MPADDVAGTFEALPLKILVADDSASVRTALRLLLARLGHEADVASDGAEALAAMTVGRYDVALVDVQMPVMGGLEAVRRFRAASHGPNPLRIIAISADESPDDRARCREAGMDDFLAKPIQSADLAAALEKHTLRPGHPGPAQEAANHSDLPLNATPRLIGLASPVF